MTNNFRNKGKQAEMKVLSYLFNRNYSFIDKNWQRKEGEIDLIVYDNSCNVLVFVEVKSRTSKKFGDIEESITATKKRKINDIIERYLIESDYKGEYRFDFIGIINGKRIIHYINVEI